MIDLKRWAALAAGAAAVCSVAQESDDDAVIEEVVVTATLRETNVMETPQAIAAVSGETIEELGVTNMQGLYRNITGLNMSEGSQTSHNRYTVRGVSSQTGVESYQQTFAAVSVYFDDTPMTSAQGPARQFGGNLFDMNRVEVLKGPQGTLFGEGSVGGTIRFIPNKPSLDGFDYKLKAGVSQNGESDDPGHRVDSMLNLPVLDSLALRITGFSEGRAGWFDNILTGENDTNAESSTGGRVAGLWVASDRLSVEASYFTVDTETNGGANGQDRFVQRENVRIPGHPPYAQDTVDIYSLNLDYEFDWATLEGSVSRMNRSAHSEFEYAASVAAFFDWFIQFNVVARAAQNPDEMPAMLAEGWVIDLANPVARTNQLAFNNDSLAESERTSFEARLVSNDDVRLRWLAGVFMKDSNDFRRDFQPFQMQPRLANATRTIAVYREFYSDPANEHVDTLDELSVFGEFTYALSATFEVTAGARWTDMEQTLEDSTLRTADRVLSPKVGISAWANDSTLVYFNVTTGFRPGNVNLGQDFNARQLSGSGDAVLPDLPPFAGNPLGLTGNEAAAIARSRVTYDGDSVTNYELGVKTRLFDSRVNVTASLYHFDWQDTILGFSEDRLPTINKNYNDNAGAAHTQGAELDVVARITERLRVRFGVDVNEAELDEAVVSPAYPEGTQLPNAPQWSGHLTVDYSQPLPGDKELNILVNHTAMAEQHQALGGADIVPERKQTNLRVNLAGYEDRWEGTLYVDNLTGEDNVVFDCSIEIIVRAACYVYQAPQVIGLEFTLRP